MNTSEFKLNLAVIIGINDYQNGVPVLGTARQDAESISEILETEYQYQVHLITDHTNIPATSHGLIEFLETTLPALLIAEKSSRLLFYFAGHGIALNGEDGPQGYLIPQDARLGDVSSYIPMQRVETALTQLACRHCLVILDCCFAGAFRWSSSRRLVSVSPIIHKERFDRFIQDPAWQVITSAASNQYALDSLDLNSDRGISKLDRRHSPFAAALMAALQGAADIYPPATRGKSAGDGVITATELYLYLRDAVEVPTDARNQRQTPQIWCLKQHDKGEFIFLPPGHVLNLPAAPSLSELEEHNPYRGLKSYETQDRELFFGRTALIHQLYNQMRDRCFTVVLGASGSGKSSLVKAGLIPHLDRQTWKILPPVRPGELPMSSLQNVFRELDIHKAEQISLPATIATWQQTHPGTKLLVVIDQWEELITICRCDQERQQFLDSLADLLQTYPDTLRLVITLRSDFEPQFRNTPLEPLWQDGRFVVPAMTRDELRAVIEEPASAKVVYFESLAQRGYLVDQLIDEVAGMPGALPLLSFALSELYLKLARRYRTANITGETLERAITWADYDALGGVTKSLTRRADEEYEALVRQDAAYEQTIRHVMLRMVAVGGELARRQVPEAELQYPEPENRLVQTVIRRFLAARLLVSGTDVHEHPYIEPAHDVLVRGWEKLLTWKQAEAENLLLQRRLSPAAAEWQSIQQQDNPAIGIPAKTKPVIHWLDRQLFTIETLLSQVPDWIGRSIRRSLSQSQRQSIGSSQAAEEFLWNANPYLEVLHDTLNRQDNWLNQIETEFVQESLLQKRRNRSWRWRITIFVILGLSGLTIAALIGQRNALINQVNASRQSAEADFRAGQQLNAFIDSLRSAKSLRHPLLRLFPPPAQLQEEVRGTLQKALYSTQERNRLEVNQGTVRSSISPNGNWTASIGEDGIVRLSNQQGHKQAEWDTQQGRSMSLSFSPDEQLLATAGADNTVRLWNLQGQQLVELQGHTDMVKGISFSPDGQQLATSSRDTTIRLWDLQGNTLAVFKGHQKDVWSVAFSPDGQMLASAADDDTFRLWNLQGKQLQKFAAGQEELHNIKFSPDGQRLATSGKDGSVRLWNLQGQRLQILQGHQGRVWSLAFSRDGQTLASSAADGTVRLWDSQGKALQVLSGHQGPVRNVSFSPDGAHLVSSGDDSTVRFWHLQSQEQKRLVGHEGPVRSLQFTPNTSELATSGEDGTIRFWNRQGEQQQRLPENLGSPGNLGPIRAIALSQDEQQLVSAQGKVVRLWNLQNQSSIDFNGHQGLVRTVAFSPDGQRLASAGTDGFIHLWDLSGTVLARWQADPVQVWQVVFSLDGQRLVSAGNNGLVQLWDLQGKSVAKLEGHLGPVYTVSFSSDGQRLASAGQDGTIRQWDLRTNQKSNLFQVYDAEVNSVAFSPNNQFLLSGDERGNLQVWDLRSQQSFAAWNAHQNSIVRQVQFSPDGKMIITVADDGLAKLWTFSTFEQLVDSGCKLIENYLRLEQHRFLSPDDRQLCS